MEALESRMVLTQLQYGLFDTGVNDLGEALSGGASDTHYIMPITQQGTPGQNAVVVSTLASGWVPNTATSAWISSSADPSTASPGVYYYRTTFNVDEVAGTGDLTGSITGDNDLIDVYINGVSTGYSRTDAFTGFVPFRTSGGIVTGTNTLDFVISNGGGSGNPTGLHAKDLSLNYKPSVAVDSSEVSIVSGASVLNSGTFSDSDLSDIVTITSSEGSVSQTGENNGTFSFFEADVATDRTVTITATDSRGAVGTTSFTILTHANVPPTLTGSDTPMTVVSGGAAVAVDPGLVLTDPDGPNLSSASVAIGANFKASEDRLVFTDQNGITGAYNVSNGILTLTGSASAEDYQTALRSVQYQNINPTSASLAPRSISFSISPGTFNPVTGHFYEFINAPGIAWTAARASALSRDVFGLKGYLATITSKAENDFAFSKTQALGWIGGSDSAVEGEWRWMDGPEAGQQFWQGLATGNSVGGLYNNWANGEPNNAGNEDYTHFLGNGQWNDYANTTQVQGYVVEYGGLAGDPVLQLTSLTTINLLKQTAAPSVSNVPGPVSINTSNFTIQGSATAGSLVQVYDDANGNGMVDEGEQLVASQIVDLNNATFAITLSLATDAPNHFVVTATQGPNIESTPTVVPTITQDSIPPDAPVVTNPSITDSVSQANVIVEGDAPAESLVTVWRDTNQNGLLDEGDQLLATQQLAADQSDYGFNLGLIPDSANAFLVTATDAAGNRSDAVVVPIVIQDSTAPAMPIVSSPELPLSTNAVDVAITGTAEAGSLVYVYENDLLVATQQLDPGQTDFNIVVGLLQDAPNDFMILAVDAAGNVSTAAFVPTITQDSLAPALPVLEFPSSAITINAESVALIGSAELGSTVYVYRDSNNDGSIDGEEVVAIQGLNAQENGFFFQVPLEPNAENRFLIVAYDAAGNASPALAVPTVTADSIAPAVPTTNLPSGPLATNKTIVTLTGTAEAGSFVTVFDDANGNGMIDEGEQVVGFQQLDNDVTIYNFTVPLAQDAPNNFLVTATDEAGNVSAPLALPTITQDSIPPEAPTGSFPDVAVAVNTATTILTGTAEAGSFVTVYRDTNGDGVIGEGDEVAGFQQLGAEETSYGIEVSLISDAPNNFLIFVTDAGGNTSPAIVVPTITQDSIQPASPIVGDPAAVLNTDAATTTLTGRAEAGSLVTVYRDTNHDGAIDEGDEVAGSQQLGPDETSFAITVSLDQDAENDFLIRTTDPAGNISVATVVPTIVEDSTDPAPPVSNGPFGPIAVNTTTRTFTGTAEAGSLVLIYRDSNGDGMIGEGDEVVGSLQLAPGQTSYEITVPLIPNAANNFLISTTDAAGNTSATIVVPTITQDSIAPISPLPGGPTGTTVVNSTMATLTGTAEAGSLVQVFDDANGNGVIDDGERVVGMQQLAPGQTTYSIIVPLKPDAANNFLVASTDAGGNRSVAIVLPTIIQDSTPPVSPTGGPGVTGTVSVSATDAVLTGTAEAGSLVQVFNDANGNGVIDDGEVVVGSVQLAPGETTYSLRVPLVSGVANRFLVASSDAGGNRSAAVALAAIMQDSIAPSQPVAGFPTSAIVVNATTATLTGTAEAGSLVQVYDDANGNGVIDDGEVVVGSVQLAPDQTSYSVTVSLHSNSANRFLVTATDAAGNTSPVAIVPTITQNAVAPRITRVRRFGYHSHPTILVLSFEGQMDAARVLNASNYRIVDSRGHAIHVAGVRFDPVANEAIIMPHSRLDVHKKYRLTVIGSGVKGLADMTGTGLASSTNGKDFTAIIDRSILAGQTPYRTVVPAHAAGVHTAHHAALDHVLAHGVRVHKAKHGK